MQHDDGVTDHVKSTDFTRQTGRCVSSNPNQLTTGQPGWHAKQAQPPQPREASCSTRSPAICVCDRLGLTIVLRTVAPSRSRNPHVHGTPPGLWSKCRDACSGLSQLSRCTQAQSIHLRCSQTSKYCCAHVILGKPRCQIAFAYVADLPYSRLSCHVCRLLDTPPESLSEASTRKFNRVCVVDMPDAETGMREHAHASPYDHPLHPAALSSDAVSRCSWQTAASGPGHVQMRHHSRQPFGAREGLASKVGQAAHKCLFDGPAVR